MTLVKISKLDRQPCANFPAFLHILIPFVGLNGSKNSGKMDIDMFLEPFTFGCVVRPGSTHISKVE